MNARVFKLAYLFFLLFFLYQNSSAQQINRKSSREALHNSNYSKQILHYFNKKENTFGNHDLDNLIIKDEYFSKTSGITHLYLQQTYNGIKIYNAISSIGIKNNKIFHVGDVFKRNIDQKINTNTSTITPKIAIEKAASHLKLNTTTNLRMIGNKKGVYTFSKGTISNKDIVANLVYCPTEEDTLKLAWDFEIHTTDNQNVWSIRVDASNGEVLDKVNYVLSCNFENTTNHESHNHSSSKKETTSKIDLFKTNTSMMVDGSSYRVYALPVESPIHGNRTIVNNPANSNASPFGWHDTDGNPGPEYTITRGNNVYAQEDINGDDGFGTAPDGGTNLTFDFPLNFSDTPSQFKSAATTNLFYVNNMMHDIWYQYGFDEASGNFQENNYGKGGIANDYLIADAQDGNGTNNANIKVLPDGQSPRMQMFIWDFANPDRDSDFDNVIIAHEFGHGISIRLAGGPSNSNCLRNSEQGGEGWSDWFGLMVSMKPGDLDTDRRGVGTYVFNQPTSGNGVRTHPYSTDFSINPFTYDSIKQERVPHGVGSVWGSILWDLTWAYVDKYGWDPDLYNGTGGNNKIMQIVLDGLKLQPCNSGFVDARDAILAADYAITGGIDQCLMWEVFAKRGLGFSATQGSPFSKSDGVEAFDTPELSIIGEILSDSCGNESLKVKVANTSGNPLTSLNYRYSIDGNQTINDTWTGNLASCETIDIPINLGTPSIGLHIVKIELLSPVAVSKSFEIVSNASGTIDAVNTFENNSDKLVNFDVANWELGDADGTLLNSTVAGSKVYKTNISNFDFDSYHLVSECYDLSNVVDAVFQFDMAFDINTDESFGTDAFYIEYSTDGGVNWQLLGSSSSPDWYNSDRQNDISCQGCVGGQWRGEGELSSSHSSGGTNASSMKTYSYPLSDFDNSGSAETNMLFRFTYYKGSEFDEGEGVIIDNFVIKSKGTLSINTPLAEETITIFPNPTSGLITVKGNKSMHQANIEVYDIMGKKLSNKIKIASFNDNTVQFNINQFATGTYFISIENEGNTFTKRIIKK